MTLTSHDLLRFRVPSSDGKQEYLVDLAANEGAGRCDCSDYRCRKAAINGKCKHILECRDDLASRVIREFRRLYPSKED